MENLDDLFLSDIAAITPCSHEEMEELTERAMMQDREAINRLVEGHLYLVPEIAKAYAGEEQKQAPSEDGEEEAKPKTKAGVELSDLISEGNTALFMAAYEYEGGNFTAFVRDRIMEAMEQMISNEEEEVLNAKRITAKVNLVNEGSSLLAKELGREASDEELAARLGLSADEVESARKMAISALNQYEGKEKAGDADDPLLREANELLKEEEGEGEEF